MAVFDASALVGALAISAEEGTWCAVQLASMDAAAPEHVLVEATNVIRRLTQAGSLSPEAGSSARLELLDLPVELYPFAPLADRVWRLRKSVTAYDAAYVALAEELGAPLVTLDRRLAGASGPRCRFLLPS